MADGIKLETISLLSQRTKRGMVNMIVGETKIQMDLDKAREVRGMLDGAIEAAISDELMFKFLNTKIGLSEESAAAALLDFRELRQGSRETVCPQ